MNKNEIRAKVAQLLSAGADRSDVFSQLSGQGIGDGMLAYIISAYPDRYRCEQHRDSVNILMLIMLVQAAIGFVIGHAMGELMGQAAQWIMATILMVIPLLFAWGFHTHKVVAYHAYFILAMLQIPQLMLQIPVAPGATMISIGIATAILAYIWRVRNLIFPGFTFIFPTKIRGSYVFP